MVVSSDHLALHAFELFSGHYLSSWTPAEWLCTINYPTNSVEQGQTQDGRPKQIAQKNTAVL